MSCVRETTELVDNALCTMKIMEYEEEKEVK